MAENPGDRAVELFAQHYNCAQSVFGALGPGEGLDCETCLVVASAFGGGIARTGETCGAVAGALMALGVRAGGATLTDPEAKAKVYVEAREFMKRFRERHGGLTCRELLGCDIGTPEGQREMKERDLHHAVCEGLVRSAAELMQLMKKL